MSFFAEFKTEIKLLLIVTFVAVVFVAGTVFVLQATQNIPGPIPNEQQAVETSTELSMEIEGYDYIFSGFGPELNGEVKIDLDGDGQQEIVRVYKEDVTGEEFLGRGKSIIAKVFSSAGDGVKEVYSYTIESFNEYYENPQPLLNLWGDDTNAVKIKAIGTGYGSGSTVRLLFLTYRNGEYKIIEGPQVAGHNWLCCKLDGEGGIGKRIIAAESRWDSLNLETGWVPGNYCAGCESRFQFFIYSWNGQKYSKIELGTTKNLYSGNIDDILQQEPSVLSVQN